MIIGIGTDLIEIERVAQMMKRHRVLDRVFTKNELLHAKGRASVLAGDFAAKEAVSKVFGTGFFGIEPFEIEVLRNEKGAPYIKLFGKAKEMARKMSIKKIHLSLTNTEYYAQAFAIGEDL
ncbi:holo-ACP synthase [Anaerostipes sp. MSJ-23]|uniref:holo-ACP synthase n=1 Tax=unclassified Anaerostipes TaxID=2635253 RepID=UPI001C1268A2|nr:holo-ACP synthase [Anaerostipes sp. MSJ-23]MBU5460093.1 holo-ACP synthase [Anaerostipes sp. MSJ-23]